MTAILVAHDGVVSSKIANIRSARAKGKWLKVRSFQHHEWNVAKLLVSSLRLPTTSENAIRTTTRMPNLPIMKRHNTVR